jgi:hypothetical protein
LLAGWLGVLAAPEGVMVWSCVIEAIHVLDFFRDLLLGNYQTL